MNTLSKQKTLIDPAATNTIRAALTYYTENNQGDPNCRDDHIHKLATGEDGYEDISLDDEGVCQLIEELFNDTTLYREAEVKAALDTQAGLLKDRILKLTEAILEIWKAPNIDIAKSTAIKSLS